MSDQLQMTDGMHIIVEALKQNNIDTIYGVVGIPVTDMARHAQAEGIRYIGFRHEQSAGYAAAASGFLTQKPGICLTVSAPGFLNGLTALANATVNGFPMIMISGSSDRAIVDLQQGDYEELDQMNAAKPYAKAAFRVNQPQDLGIALARAIRVSVSGRPGGVYLDLPANVLAATMEKDEALTTIVKVENPSPALLPCPKSVTSAISLLAKAERPLIILGKGAAYSQADEQLREFIESTQIPFLPMSMAKGILEDTHPLSAAAARSFALANADVVMLVGARLNWLLAHGKKGWAADTQFIQLDIEPQEIDSNRPIAVPVVGDIASSMQGMLAELKQNTFTTPLVWRDILNIHKQQNAQKMHEKLSTDTQPLNYFNALSAVRDVLRENQDIYLVNEGANTLDNARNIIDMYKPRRRLDCGTWGVMGIGMGYAIGASVTSGSPVVAIEGDSAFEHYFTADYYKNAMLPLENSDSPFKDVFSNAHEVTAETKENRTIYTQVFEIDNGIEKRCINHWHTLCNLPASDNAVYICGWQDITETRDLINALEVEKNKAIKATVAKSQFLATMSHEIRTPISSIMGFLELLSGSGLSKEQRVEAISLAYATGQSLLGLIGEILDVDKIESGNYQLQPQWVDIPTLVQNTCHSFGAIAASKSIALSCSSTFPDHYLVKIDPQAFKQVLSNLLSNALKFTTEGAVKITTSLVHIDDNHAVIKMTIMDSGSGLSQEEQQQLFKRYSQTSAGRQQTGSGLGLMICKELIKNMQGDLSLESHPGIGTTFTITIPVEISQQVATVEAKAEHPITLPEKLSILIADDHPTNRLLLKRQLNLLGYDVDEATDGVQALHKVSMQHYDLLITDVNMPNMDGFELTRKLREQNSSLPIWGLTANAQANEREKGLSCGMNLCLFKPLTLDVLKTHLSQLHQVAHIAPQYRHLDIEALKNNTANDLQLMQEILMTFQHETHKDLPAAFQALEAGDNRTFHQCIHRIHGAANILNLQKLINISHQLEITPVSDDSKPEILQLLNSVKEHIAELDQEIAVFCQKND
ncbi:oxalyl-CoA decarboxylase [Escherichia coli]